MNTISITSGKGGVGKTTLAANLSIALSQQGQRVVLFDADLQLANLDVALGIKPEFNLQHVVAGERSLQDILTPGPGGIRVVTGGSAVTSLMSAGPKRMGTFLSQLESLEDECDFLVFDTGAGLDNKVMTFLRLAHEILLVTTPDPTSVTDAYATAKVAFKKDPYAFVRVVVNQCLSEPEGQAVFNTLESITWSFLQKNLHYLGHIRSDAAASASIRKRNPVVVGDPESASAQDIIRLASRLLNDPVKSHRAA